MTPLDIRPLPLSEPFASRGIAVSDYCGFVDEAVILAILGKDASDFKARFQPVLSQFKAQPRMALVDGSAPYFGERRMAFAR